MTLVKTLETFKKHVTINFNFDFELILPYIIKAERKHLKPAMGTGMYEDFTETEPTDPKPLQVMGLLQEASSNLALLAYTAVGIVSISDSGFSISSSEQTTPAEWWQIRDLRRALLNSGTEAIDEALAIMEANPAEFTDWTEGEGYTVFREFFVRKTQDFQRWFNINNSRLTFQQLRPHLLQVEEKYFNALLGQATVAQIKLATTDEAEKALSLAQASQVSLTIAEISDEGLFLFTPQGLFTATNEVPGEKKTGLTVPEIENLSRKKQAIGQGYLNNLVTHLQQYPTIFVAYAAKEAELIVNPAYTNGSILSL